MNVAQWITVSVVAQGDKFLALPHMRRQRDPAFLVFHGAWQSNRRQGIALGQDQSTLRQWQAEQSAIQSQRIRAGKSAARKTQYTTTQRR